MSSSGSEWELPPSEDSDDDDEVMEEVDASDLQEVSSSSSSSSSSTSPSSGAQLFDVVQRQRLRNQSEVKQMAGVALCMPLHYFCHLGTIVVFKHDGAIVMMAHVGMDVFNIMYACLGQRRLSLDVMAHLATFVTDSPVLSHFVTTLRCLGSATTSTTMSCAVTSTNSEGQHFAILVHKGQKKYNFKFHAPAQFSYPERIVLDNGVKTFDERADSVYEFDNRANPGVLRITVYVAANQIFDLRPPPNETVDAQKTAALIALCSVGHAAKSSDEDARNNLPTLGGGLKIHLKPARADTAPTAPVEEWRTAHTGATTLVELVVRFAGMSGEEFFLWKCGTPIFYGPILDYACRVRIAAADEAHRSRLLSEAAITLQALYHVRPDGRVIPACAETWREFVVYTRLRLSPSDTSTLRVKDGDLVVGPLQNIKFAVRLRLSEPLVHSFIDCYGHPRSDSFDRIVFTGCGTEHVSSAEHILMNIKANGLLPSLCCRQTEDAFEEPLTEQDIASFLLNYEPGRSQFTADGRLVGPDHRVGRVVLFKTYSDDAVRLLPSLDERSSFRYLKVWVLRKVVPHNMPIRTAQVRVIAPGSMQPSYLTLRDLRCNTVSEVLAAPTDISERWPVQLHGEFSYNVTPFFGTLNEAMEYHGLVPADPDANVRFWGGGNLAIPLVFEPGHSACDLIVPANVVSDKKVIEHVIKERRAFLFRNADALKEQLKWIGPLPVNMDENSPRYGCWHARPTVVPQSFLHSKFRHAVDLLSVLISNQPGAIGPVFDFRCERAYANLPRYLLPRVWDKPRDWGIFPRGLKNAGVKPHPMCPQHLCRYAASLQSHRGPPPPMVGGMVEEHGSAATRLVPVAGATEHDLQGISFWQVAPLPAHLERLLFELRTIPAGAQLHDFYYTKRGSGISAAGKISNISPDFTCFPQDMPLSHLKGMIRDVKLSLHHKYNIKVSLRAFLNRLHCKIHRCYSILGRSRLETMPDDVPAETRSALEAVRMNPKERLQLPGSRPLLVRSIVICHEKPHNAC